MTKGNMYEDAIYRWNVFVGCEFDCIYCKKSFKAQMRRQIHNCELCGNYIPHFHEERLNKKLPKTRGDQFIWVGSSGDISFISNDNMEHILNKIKEYPDRTFFFQTKDPEWFSQWVFPSNTILGITLETDRNTKLLEFSKAPSPLTRFYDFKDIKHHRKFITIEPILKFNLGVFLRMIQGLKPERIYIGYDSKKNNLPEPSLKKVRHLISIMKDFTKVKEKLMREAWDE
ncbi:hypothetical protein LCGC14_1474660 [marine sediment metagenome]|uniref:DUF5131 family protein n=1 Tax=marine sediment metagenome TaxID=412755 RepID=A0A0F9LRS9_9ZZZZ